LLFQSDVFDILIAIILMAFDHFFAVLSLAELAYDLTKFFSRCIVKSSLFLVTK